MINTQKIYLNKETNIVEQIIREDYDYFERYTDETFGDNFYMVLDSDNIINGYNVRYNKELLQFEILATVKSHTESYIEPNETQIQIKELKEENKNLNNKLDLILQQQLELQKYIKNLRINRKEDY